MTKEEMYLFIAAHKLAVVSSVTVDGKSQSALLGIAVSEELEIIFDTVRSSRKYVNLMHNNKVSMVVGWDDETTVQYEGEARELEGDEMEYYRNLYFETWPDGRERLHWPGITHFVIRPKWIRYSNFNVPQLIEEMRF